MRSLVPRAIGLLLACAAGSASHDTGAASPSSGAASSGGAQQRRASIHYDIAGVEPLPFVRGTLGREATWMLLDTGASTHVATASIARRAGVRTTATGDKIEDNARVRISSSRAELAQVSFDGWGHMPQGNLLVIEEASESVVSKANVGVFLSPQRLEEGRVVILDLRVAELRTADEMDVIRTMATRPSDPLQKGVKSCSGIFVVGARIEGQPADLLIDTGATRSFLYDGSAAGKQLASRSTKSNLEAEVPSGKVVSRTLRGAHLEAGDWQTTSDIEILPGHTPADCTADGVLGFPALRACVLVFGPRRGQLRAKC